MRFSSLISGLIVTIVAAGTLVAQPANPAPAPEKMPLETRSVFNHLSQPGS